MTLITREQLLNPLPTRIEKVEIEEMGGHVFVKSLSEQQRTEFEMSLMKGNGNLSRKSLASGRRRLVALCVCDKDGNCLLTEDDAKRLAEQSAAVVDRLYAIAQQLCGLKDDDLETLVKNSTTSHADDSPTA